MLFMKRSILSGAIFSLLMFTAAFTGIGWTADINPAQEQQFKDAKGALEAARNVQADKLAPSYIKQAEDFLQTANNARQMQDAALFSRASLLARAYAELAEALAELETDIGKLSATREELQKVKADIEQLKNKP
jgi:hypothetical protein